MRILFLQDRAYFSWAAGVKINRILAQMLSLRGFEVWAVVTLGNDDSYTFQPEEIGEQIHRNDKFLLIRDKDSLVRICSDMKAYKDIVRISTLEFDPDLIFYCETQSYKTLRCLPSKYLRRCVIAVHCVETLPFGPLALFPDDEATKLFEAAAGSIVVSEFLREYVACHTGVRPTVVHFPAYGEGPFPDYGCFEEGLILMINPSGIKGLPIFLELARAFPEAEFGAAATWATSDRDLQALQAMPNVRLVPPSPNIDDILSQARILVVPSLSHEAHGVIVVEAMLRGLPVLASKVGGLPEAKLGVKFVLPVRPINEWEFVLERGGLVAQPVLSPQNVSSWISALDQLLHDPAEYQTLSAESRKVAHEFLTNASIKGFEDYFQDITHLYARNPRKARGHSQ